MPLTSGNDTLFHFDEPRDAGKWQAVNDGVMGGVSDGRFEVTKDGTLRFFGSVSLENNGGFASIRSLPNERDLSGYDGILLRIKGDGRRYAINLRTDHEVMACSYRRKFETHPGLWHQAFFPFSTFELTSFGRPIPDGPTLNTRKIRSVGFLISDKQAGPFELQVDWIRAVKHSPRLEERILSAGCATCILNMPGVTGCRLGVEVGGKNYLVDGSGIDDHGDAHAADGLCSVRRAALATGEVRGERFVATEFRLLSD